MKKITIKSDLTFDQAMKEIRVLSNMAGYVKTSFIPDCFVNDFNNFMAGKIRQNTIIGNEEVVHSLLFKRWYDKVKSNDLDYSITFVS